MNYDELFIKRLENMSLDLKMMLMSGMLNYTQEKYLKEAESNIDSTIQSLKRDLNNKGNDIND